MSTIARRDVQMEEAFPQAQVPPAELTIDELVAQTKKIHEAMQRVMVDGVHYGTIPGTPKPTLLQPGAQKLVLLFRLEPTFDSRELGGDGAHLTIKSTCTLTHIPTGRRVGAGEGSCSTRESKYAYRQSKRVCPACGKDSIIRGKQEYGGGWLCFKKQGGCGAKFTDGDAAIEGQATGQVANADLADAYNTVLKMANKRALVAAVLNVTAASDIFTQDLEDQAPADAAPMAGQLTAAMRDRIVTQFAGLHIDVPALEAHVETPIGAWTVREQEKLRALYAEVKRVRKGQTAAELLEGAGATGEDLGEGR